ncbi:MAG TPA: hypothetical protein VKD22_12680 [Ramlibacter sp.]|nr:hypothetical protein [Ramlibacter sp.]
MKYHERLSYRFEIDDNMTVQWIIVTKHGPEDEYDQCKIGDLRCSKDGTLHIPEDPGVYIFDDETPQAIIEHVYSAYVLAVMDKIAVLRNRVKRKRGEE